MMGQQKSERELFSYTVNLEKRVRRDHPLRQVAGAIDFGFVREAVAHCYGANGNVSVDPEVIMKMMFLLFFDDVASERELMKIIAERLDYLWFLGYGLDDEIPDHSVLSKARARWGGQVFESLFVRTIRECVEAGLVDLAQAACRFELAGGRCGQRECDQRCAGADCGVKARLCGDREQTLRDDYAGRLRSDQ
jgi:transposase